MAIVSKIDVPLGVVYVERVAWCQGTGKSFTVKEMGCLYPCLLAALREGLFSQERILMRPVRLPRIV
jgi:hypothetical protein